MMNLVNEFLSNLPPLKKRKNSGVASILGFFFGGIGLVIYLQSPVDFLIPIFITLVLFVVLPGIGILVGAVVSGLWGYFRVENSNEKLNGKP
jgi:TM2 domain-containing membrane protein YozV